MAGRLDGYRAFELVIMVSSSARLTLRGISYTPLITFLAVSSKVACIFSFAYPTISTRFNEYSCAA